MNRVSDGGKHFRGPGFIRKHPAAVVRHHDAGSARVEAEKCFIGRENALEEERKRARLHEFTELLGGLRLNGLALRRAGRTAGGIQVDREGDNTGVRSVQ